MNPIIYDGWPKGMDNRRANHDGGLIWLGVFTATMSDPKK